MNQYNIPEPVLRRLPGYLHLFESLKDEGVERISSGKIAELMGATASQIRQDFSCFGKLGQQGYGYSVAKLAEQFAEILGINSKRRVILLGAGHLGRAIGVNFPFDRYGFELTAAFDTSEELFGKELTQGVIIHSVAELEEYINT
ncbi:MAG: redox-sensing transcriptional repressor Rex, partial [Oscillospiraceae bacterium]|nr:redox-sensing transcriptional repressor Rex [Oscillospiraceae bacterium]